MLEQGQMSAAYDVVVVGGGSAGAVMAARLSEDAGRKVLLIEAGPDYPDIEQLPDDLKYGFGTGHLTGHARNAVNVADKHLWQFEARGTAEAPPMTIFRGKATGGSSAVNGQIFQRGVREDYDAWAAAGNDGWAAEDLLPHFRRSEDDHDLDGELHGRGGPIPVTRLPRERWSPIQEAFYRSCRSLGFPDWPDGNDLVSTGVGASPMNNPDRIRFSTAIGYLGPARDRANLTVAPHTQARRVIFDGTRAVAVEVETEGRVSVVAAGEVVLSAGAVGSPQLLLLSGVGPASHLAEVGVDLVRDLPGVGRGLQDHPAAAVCWSVSPEALDDPELAPLVQVKLKTTAPGSPMRNDIMVTPILWEGTLTMYASVMAPLSRGELRLRSADPLEPPQLDYRYLEESFDLQRLRDVVRLALALADREPLAGMLEKRITPEDAVVVDDDALDRWLRQSVVSTQHISCTSRMGPARDPLAVVDSEGRVHGVDALRVVDGSIMPTIPRVGPNATTVMLAERIVAAMA